MYEMKNAFKWAEQMKLILNAMSKVYVVGWLPTTCHIAN